MKLQAALDYFTLEEALKLMEIIHPYVDIAEIGSPLMYGEGFRAVTEMKRRYPDLQVLADMKIVDGGFDIADAAYKAGADIVTVIGSANDETLKGVVKAAKAHDRKSMTDTIGIDKPGSRVKALDEMGFDYILLHTAHDTLEHAAAPVESVKEAKRAAQHAQIGISGGINLTCIEEICSAAPDWVVVGSGITLSDNPLETVRKLREYIREQRVV
ncbi:MAG: orotidine 5'-phosphate decarboxylase [Clostridium sp.]|nr:orotidine 5'-phosphate decarboxylase [Clostridium sp.]